MIKFLHPIFFSSLLLAAPLFLQAGGILIETDSGYAFYSSSSALTLQYNTHHGSVARAPHGPLSSSSIIFRALPTHWLISDDALGLYALAQGQPVLQHLAVGSASAAAVSAPPEGARIEGMPNSRQLLLSRNRNEFFLFDLKTSQEKPLIKLDYPVEQAFYNQNRNLLIVSYYHRLDAYTNPAQGMFRSSRQNFIDLIDLNAKQKETIEGGYPTYNASLQEIIFFKERSAFALNLAGKTVEALPLAFPEYLDRIDGSWSAPQIWRQASGLFWVRALRTRNDLTAKERKERIAPSGSKLAIFNAKQKTWQIKASSFSAKAAVFYADNWPQLFLEGKSP